MIPLGLFDLMKIWKPRIPSNMLVGESACKSALSFRPRSRQKPIGSQKKLHHRLDSTYKIFFIFAKVIVLVHSSLVDEQQRKFAMYLAN